MRQELSDQERRLAEALGALVQQIDINDYRDGLGHDIKMNIAYKHAQAIVDEFGVSHEDICRVLDSCEDDFEFAARELAGRGSARKRERTPTEHQTRRMGP